MIVAIKLDPKSYRRIGEFVEKGRYESIESFVEIAVLNQILLETHGTSSLGLRKEIEIPAREEDGHKQIQVRRQLGAQQSYQYLACPKDASIPVLPPLVLTEETKARPIWGQINRLAPAKIVLRMLANNVLLGMDRIDLKRFSADVAEAATVLRTFIEKKDKKNRIRGKELYIALPKKDPSSQQRFMSFYVGKLPSGKWTDGVLTGLGLARIEQAEDGSTVIGLTESGRTLACLPSPLIDEFLLDGKQIEEPFSSSEVEFLLKQLEANRQGEFEYMISVLQFIKEGSDTPTSLRQKVGVFLRNHYPTMTISEKLVNTMLVGLMGRLVEMHLVEIEKDAQKSKYFVTRAGDSLANRKVRA